MEFQPMEGEFFRLILIVGASKNISRVALKAIVYGDRRKHG